MDNLTFKKILPGWVQMDCDKSVLLHFHGEGEYYIVAKAFDTHFCTNCYTDAPDSVVAYAALADLYVPEELQAQNMSVVQVGSHDILIMKEAGSSWPVYWRAPHDGKGKVLPRRNKKESKCGL